MIDLAILGLLKEQDLHGYELRKRLAELPGARSGVVSFGSLYPGARPPRAGRAREGRRGQHPHRPAPCRRAARSPASSPPSGPGTCRAAGGRSKKVYGITARGEARPRRSCSPTLSRVDERTFALRVAFCRFLSTDERLAMFERRRAELARRRVAERRRDASDGVLDRYRRTLARARRRIPSPTTSPGSSG